VTPTVRRLGDDDWEVLREVRLAALYDAPYAFGSAHADELGHDEATWRARLAAQAWFVAFDGEATVGVASGGQLREPDPDVRTLRSMWVDVAHRGGGVADQLVAAVAAWARADGARRLTLWATEEAQRARAFYTRAGFAATGEGRAIDGRDGVEMARYELVL